MRFCLGLTLFAAATGLSIPAYATNDDLEVWLNPSVAADLDNDTGIELETAQRLRSADRGRVDTYYARLWLNQELDDNLTVSGGVERRVNDGGDDETRFLQQLSVKKGFFRGRFRLEQRFVDNNGGRMGLRIRSRLGVSVPFDEAKRWSFDTSAEFAKTLRSTSAGGKDGLTGLRTQLGVNYKVDEKLTIGLAYLRQQDFTDNAPDPVGHAPLLALDFSF
jgi:hypothetical protein